MTQYDPDVIRRYADRLYARAAAIIWWYTFGYAITGLIGGLIVGSLIAHKSGWQVYFGVGVGIVMAIIGWQIGIDRAFYLKLEAQKALCQVQIEENTRVQADRMTAEADREAI